MSLYVVAYDISDNARRRKVARRLETWGTRIQYSVFEVWLEPKEFKSFQFQIGSLLSKSDRVDIVPVDERGTRNRVRWQQPPTDYSPVLVRHPSSTDLW